MFLEGDCTQGRGGYGNFGGYVVFVPDELCCALADVASECLCLGLPSCLFCGRAACSGVDDGEVFADSEPSLVGILDGIDDPTLGCGDSSGAITGDLAGCTQLVGSGADDGQVSTGSLS